jgi:hypothetical protein
MSIKLNEKRPKKRDYTKKENVIKVDYQVK